MTPIEFCYWLQGWAELEDGKTPKMEQWKLIIAHLQLVFDKQTPSMEPLLEEDKNAQGYFYEVDLPSVEDLLPADDKPADDENLREKLQEAIDQINHRESTPTQLDFAPPRCSNRPPSIPLDNTLICSNSEDVSVRFCLSGNSLQQDGPVVPRRGRDDVK